jgi:transposase
MFYFLCIIWLEQKLIPNLPPNSVIVLDNASYHNVQDDKPPTFSSKRNVMKVWLDTCVIRYQEGSTKVKLFQLIKINKETNPNFNVIKHSLLARYGHVALRLLPYHPELNPIEKMRAMEKTGWR